MKSILHLNLPIKSLEKSNSCWEKKSILLNKMFCSSERIFGYKDLGIDIYCLSSSLNFYLNIEFAEKINPKKHQQFKVKLNEKEKRQKHLLSFPGWWRCQSIEWMVAILDNDESRSILIEIKNRTRIRHFRWTNINLWIKRRKVNIIFNSSCQWEFLWWSKISRMVHSSRDFSCFFHWCCIKNR